ncbi:hypothetical protein [Rhodoligotrophos defluvii]|uniref:hypothetical protein n=1 Tax=Rhodoligotrophos defluvii TaxID=2561934 RepID=UPI0010C9FB54|nr:hypothetical protein [Rhodoligotrophos defluvii]
MAKGTDVYIAVGSYNEGGRYFVTISHSSGDPLIMSPEGARLVAKSLLQWARHADEKNVTCAWRQVKQYIVEWKDHAQAVEEASSKEEPHWEEVKS